MLESGSEGEGGPDFQVAATFKLTNTQLQVLECGPEEDNPWRVGIWALRHTRRQGYEASKVDSLKPRKYIHSGRLITLPPYVPLEPRYPQAGALRFSVDGREYVFWSLS